MVKVKALFLIPLRDNDGTDLGSLIDELEASLFANFFGWTLWGTVRGAYLMKDGTKAVDENLPYAVFTDESQIENLENMLRAFKLKTKQESIYLEIQHHVELRLVQ